MKLECIKAIMCVDFREPSTIGDWQHSVILNADKNASFLEKYILCSVNLINIDKDKKIPKFLQGITYQDDIIFDKNNKFTLFLKSFSGAPLFTLEELKIWEECFNQIGIIKVGKYPSKKSLITK